MPIRRASMRLRSRLAGRATPAAAVALPAALARLRPHGRRRYEGRKQKANEREEAKRAQHVRTPGGAGSMLSGRTSTCAPARADPGYLKDQIAFGVTLLFCDI